LSIIDLNDGLAAHWTDVISLCPRLEAILMENVFLVTPKLYNFVLLDVLFIL
jgi:hypothetical protein